MFPSLGRSEIERVRRFGVVRSYAAGEALAKVGEVGHGLTIILVGKVDIARHDESGRREPIVTHGPGSFMGELAQLAGRPALVGAYALGAVEGLTGAEAGGRPPIAGDKSRRMPLPSADVRSSSVKRLTAGPRGRAGGGGAPCVFNCDRPRPPGARRWENPIQTNESSETPSRHDAQCRGREETRPQANLAISIRSNI